MGSPWLPEADYARIRASWRGAPGKAPPLTNRAAVEMAHLNVQEAARREADLRALYRELPQGDPLLLGNEHESPLALRIAMAAGDQRHWREYGAYYRARGERDGWDVVVPVIGTGQREAPPRRLKAVPQEPDRRLPRERDLGDDDVEGGLPF